MPRRRAPRVPLEDEARALGLARDVLVAGTPDVRRLHGVVHTPSIIARDIVRRADAELLRMGVRNGLAADDLVVVDPSCGPGVFLAAAVDHLASRSRVASRFVGLDIDADAIAQARGLLGHVCDERGIALSLHAEDTLAREPASLIGGAARVVVLGNPPWAARTPLRGQRATDAMLEAFRMDANGAPLEERKIGVLSDAYVRFFRFCAEVIRVAPEGGVLALVTNGSYLDGPVHRGMRGALLRWFERVSVVDLGGSALVAQTKGGARDENVFGVRPTVAITVASRGPSHGELLPAAELGYTRVRGSRAEKLEALANEVVVERIVPTAPGYVFRPTPKRGAGEVCLGLDAIFAFHREGVQTNRDGAVIAPDAAALCARLERFVRGEADDALERAYVASGHYDPRRARANVADALARDPDGTLGISVLPIAYRPFDERVYAPIAPFCHRPRLDLAKAVAGASLTLVTVRKDRGEAEWMHFGAVRAVPDNCLLSNRSSCRTRAFPSHGPDGEPNVTPFARDAFAQRLGRAPEPRELVAYVLATLASETYRASFADVLRLEYPEVPMPSDAAAFDHRVRAGEALAAAFLDAPGAHHAKVGHYPIQIAPSSLARALSDAEHAYRERK